MKPEYMTQKDWDAEMELAAEVSSDVGMKEEKIDEETWEKEIEKDLH